MAIECAADLASELGKLAGQTLGLYERALDLRQLAVAERLLDALEALCEAEPTCSSALEEAYLRIGV
ncbi:MAG: hypothetical protein ABT20_02735 [Rubrivivax sp. SCN 70-15]|nr:MAG: hypothetical protein ABT20_02735 [Rubrivivax sp. SCN 70-15]